MPHHRYTPRNVPPSFLDRLLNHSFEIHIALLMVIIGAVLLEAGVQGPRSPAVPAWWASLALGLFFLAGGLLVWLGLFRDSAYLNRDWMRERMGLVLGSAGLLGLSASVFMVNPANVLAWVQPLIFVSAATFRIVATFTEEHQRREAVSRWRSRSGDEGTSS